MGAVPFGLATVFSVFELAPFRLIWGLTLFPLVVTTALSAWGRFFAPLRDTNPIIQGTGMRTDRRVFALLLRVQLSDYVLLAIALLLMVSVIVLCEGPLIWLTPVLVAIALWIVWFGIQTVRIGDAIVALASDQPALVLRLLSPALRRPRMLQPSWRSVCRFCLGAANMKLGEPEIALADLRLVDGPSTIAATLLRGQLLVGRGAIDAARTILEQTSPTNLGEEMLWAGLFGLIALEDGYPDRVLEQAEYWEDLTKRTSPHAARLLLLLLTVAAERSNQDSLADAYRSRIRDLAAARRWMERAWPALWPSP